MLPPYCETVSLTGSGRPVLVPFEIESVIFDDVGLEFCSSESGPQASDAGGVRDGILTLTSHRIIWTPGQNSNPPSSSPGPSPQPCFAIAVMYVTSARQQKKSVKHMFASPRIILTIRVPQKTQKAEASSQPPASSINPLFQQSAPHSQQRFSTFEATIVFRGQSGPDTFLKKFPEVTSLRKWEMTPPPSQSQQPLPGGSTRGGAPAGVGTPLAPVAHVPFSPGMAGVGGILRREQERMQQTEQGLKEAFSDLNALMAKASEMVQLAERMRTFMQKTEAKSRSSGGDQTGEGDSSAATSAAATAAGFSSAQEMQDWLLSVGIASPVTKESAGALFHQELSRQLADFVEDPLRRSGGMLSLVDVYCLFNRARGTELISPDDLLKACSMWGAVFRPPVRLRRFASGVLVVQLESCSQEKMLGTILGLLSGPDPMRVGVDAVEIANALGVGTALAKEELLTAEQQGHLCRDDGPEGLRFFRNFFKDVAVA